MKNKRVTDEEVENWGGFIPFEVECGGEVTILKYIKSEIRKKKKRE